MVKMTIDPPEKLLCAACFEGRRMLPVPFSPVFILPLGRAFQQTKNSMLLFENVRKHDHWDSRLYFIFYHCAVTDFFQNIVHVDENIQMDPVAAPDELCALARSGNSQS